MTTETRIDPYRGFIFLLEIGGVTVAGFQECSGLGADIDIVDYREGSDSGHERLEIKRDLSVTLSRGSTHSAELWKWRQTVTDGAAGRRSGSIILRDETGADILRWNFTDGWLSKWTGPSFNTAADSITIDSLEVTVEEIVRADLLKRGA
jgi:phage tail-like protein